MTSARRERRAGRGDWVRRALVGVVLLAAITCVALGLSTDPGADGGARAAGPATPGWSARRVPQAVVDAVGAQRLQLALDGATADDGSCFTVRDESGPVAAARETEPLVPASTAKLLTSAVALAVLGPEFRFETAVVADAPVRDGTVERLWLVGDGDPLLVSPEVAAAREQDPGTRGTAVTPLASLADEIVAAGVRSVPRGIAGDDSHHDRTRALASWPARYREERNIGSLSALTVDQGFAGPAGSGPPVDDPATFAAEALSRLLEERGVSVGPAGSGTAPADATPVASVTSPPLTDVITEFLATSDNLAGELLMREIAVAAGRPGTTEEGLAVARTTLADLGMPVGGLVLADGSGLSRDNRVTCALLVDVLALADRDPRYAVLRTGLAVAGERGTLATRLRGTPLAGRLVAKTGSLSGVSGLAGSIDVVRPVQFSLLLNGEFGESAGIAQRERLAQIIASYPDAPGPDALVPAP